MNAIGARTLKYLKGEKDLFEERKRLAEVKKKVENSNLSYWLTGVSNNEPRKVSKIIKR